MNDNELTDRQIIYAKLVDVLGSVAFVNEVEELKGATPERLKAFIEKNCKS